MGELAFALRLKLKGHLTMILLRWNNIANYAKVIFSAPATTFRGIPARRARPGLPRFVSPKMLFDVFVLYIFIHFMQYLSLHKSFSTAKIRGFAPSIRLVPALRSSAHLSLDTMAFSLHVQAPACSTAVQR